MPKQERKEIISQYNKGNIDVLCNCQLLTEGFDDPGIENIIISRPTKSKALFCQMIGRGLRPNMNKNHCNIYNMGDKIHNVLSFNVLGDNNSIVPNFGEKLTDTVCRTKEDVPSIQNLSYEWEKIRISNEDNKKGHVFYDIAFAYYGIPSYDFIELTQKQKNLLIFKSRLLEENGFNSRDHWEKWKSSFSMPYQEKK